MTSPFTFNLKFEGENSNKNNDLKHRKHTDITIPPIDYAKGRMNYKIALYSNLAKPNSPCKESNRYRWKEGGSKIIRNSDMCQILDGSMKMIAQPKLGAPKVVEMVLPKIIHARTPAELEKIKTESEEALRKKEQLERDTLALSHLLPLEASVSQLPRALTPKSSKRLVYTSEKRHKHRHRNVSKMCRHKIIQADQSETTSHAPETEIENEAGLDIQWTYSTMNLNDEVEDFLEDEAVLNASSLDKADVEMSSELQQADVSAATTETNSTIPNTEGAPPGNMVEKTDVAGSTDHTHSAHTLAIEANAASSMDQIPVPSTAPLVIEHTDKAKETENANLEEKKIVIPVPEPLIITLAATTANEVVDQDLKKLLLPVINGNKAFTRAVAILQPKDIRAILPKGIHFSTFRWKYAIESAFRKNRIRKLPNVQTKPFDYSQFNIEEEMNKFKRSQIERLEKSMEIFKRLPEPKQRHLDLIILKFEESLRKAFPWFQGLKSAIRTQFAQCARIEYHPRGRKITREGDSTRTVYMLAFGLAVEHKETVEADGQKKDQAIGLVRAGTCIGEILGNAVPKRTTSVTALTRSLFVCIEKDDWMRAMKKGENEASRIEAISNLPLFESLPLKQIELLSTVCSEANAVTNTIILEPFHEPINFFFITKGKCSLTLHVPLVKTVKDTVKHLIAPSEYQLVPYYGQPLKAGKDEMVHSTFPMAELGPGDCFPPLYLRDIRGTYKSYTVTSLEAIEVIVFNIPTVHSMFPTEVLAGIRAQQEGVFYIDSQVREVQEHYLSTKGWRNDHESIMAQMLTSEIDKEREERVALRFGKRNIYAPAQSSQEKEKLMPLSIEELLERKKRESEGTNKPVFLSKEQRAQIALEKRQAQVENARKEQGNTRVKVADLFSISKAPSPQPPPSRNDYRKRTRDELSKATAAPAEDEFTMMKAKYLGEEKEKRKIRKMNDKKFIFDWDKEEDTSIDINPIYNKKQPIQLMGRSKLAGYGSLDKASNEKHWSLKKLDDMAERDWRIFKEDYTISVKGSNVPHPLRSWKESDIPGPILRVIDQVGYKEPTPIQRQAIPIAMQGRDIIGVAETGSGKTASFVIPMLCFIKDLPLLDQGNSHLGPYALVMAPTRELALQIETEATKFAKEMNLICVSIVGGHSVESQTTNLLRGAHIIIATPGRLRDLLDRRILALAQCVYVVLDEADRMVDLGFEPDLKYILASMPSTNMKPDNDQAEDSGWLISQLKSQNPFRQTVMFSATMPPPVEQLAKEYLRRPVNVTVGVVGQVVDRIEQRVEMISDEGAKLNRIQKIFGSGEFQSPMIVFVNQKKNCDSVARTLEQRGFRCAVLHGGKSQDQREAALAGLKDGSKEVLIATDVAGRGIDVKNVSLVVNFDMAKSIEDYTHRIGRTGRAGRKGTAITFLSSWDKDVYFDLKLVLQKSPLSKAPKEFFQHESSLQKQSATKGGGNINN